MILDQLDFSWVVTSVSADANLVRRVLGSS
jgi:hypothetical protein